MMDLNKYLNLCKTLGKAMNDGEEWKATKYIHTPGQGSPAFDVEILLNKNEIEFVNDESRPGFIVTEYPSAEVALQVNNKIPVKTFFDLNHITDVSLLIDDDIIDIYDIVNKYEPVGYPVKIWFVTDPPNYVRNNHLWYRFKNYKDMKIAYRMSRNLKVDKDYIITIKDENGNEVESIKNQGDYTLTIEAIGDYYGSAYCYVTIEHDLKDDNEENSSTKDTGLAIDGVSYDSIEEALLNAVDGSTLTISTDVSVNDPIMVEGKSITLNLNNGSISNSNGRAIVVNNGGSVTINGEGAVSGGSGGDYSAVVAYPGGTVTINGGTYSVGADAHGLGNSTIYANGGTIIINGGTFSSDALYNNRYYVLNLNNSTDLNSSISVVEATIIGQDPSLGDDFLGGSFVADGSIVTKSINDEGITVYNVTAQ